MRSSGVHEDGQVRRLARSGLEPGHQQEATAEAVLSATAKAVRRAATLLSRAARGLALKIGKEEGAIPERFLPNKVAN